MLYSSPISAQEKIRVVEKDDLIEIDTDQLNVQIRKKGYVSGIAAGTFLDKKTGAKDIGFGLHIMDFLLAPGWKDDGYLREKKYHGELPKHYIEGPQICTQAKELTPEIIRGKDFVAVILRYRFTKPAKGLKAGSTWEQVMIFQPNVRYMLSSERITSVNTVKDLLYRIDMPGHIKHKDADSFEQIYLSYLEKPLPAKSFLTDFAPDDKYLYQRNDKKILDRMIRAYQVKIKGKPGPWLAGATLDPAAVSEAWCHQRGYVCFIQELHQRDVKAGESFGAAYAVGWFDEIKDVEAVCDRYKGKKSITVSKDKFTLE
jgi:hypothetical protein